MSSAYKISVVMAVYNAEDFLRETIDSLLCQDIGFENIQLILVDDGSTDGSGGICDEYAEKYPRNILALHKENGGVSSARNLGLRYVRGDYVNFLDSDDKLSGNACRLVCDFFARHSGETDLVSIPMKFFDASSGDHVLNYKYSSGTRVIDLLNQWDAPQLSSSSCFIRRECLEGREFDTRLAYAEDAKLVQQVLLEKFTMGVVAEAAYWYRRRSSGTSSAVQSSGQKPAYYIPYARHFVEDTISYCLEKLGQVPRFVQFCLMYDIQWRIKFDEFPADVLTEPEQEEYKERLFGALRYIDADVINAQKNIWTEHKLFLFRKKYGDQLRLYAGGNNLTLLADGRSLFNLRLILVRFEFAKIQKDRCVIEGRIPIVWPELMDSLSLSVCCGENEYPCALTPLSEGTKVLGEQISESVAFRAELPLPQDGHITFRITAMGVTSMLDRFRCGRFFPISRELPNSYYSENGFLLELVDGGFRIQKAGAAARLRHELRFLKGLLKDRSGNSDLRSACKKALLIRPASYFLRRLKRKPLWLISDRVMRADDSGIAFFMYMRENHPEIDARFVISAGSPDYPAVRKIGPVLKEGSFAHKLLLLCSDHIISSMAEEPVYNPFAGHDLPYRDLLAKTRFVFLQHGIIKDDLSRWLNRYAKNLYGFVTSTRPEYDSIVDGNYHYSAEHIWLTGLPRYDRLYRNEQKQITIMPTWRKYLMGTWDQNTDIWSLGESFQSSEYLRFYNGLLGSERLLAAARRLGYTIAFLPHPNLQDHLDVFVHNGQVRFLGREAAYRDIYAASDLVVTDYSSAVFDFAYLHKPVIYAQFDREEFFAGEHVYEKGYFDYERDGLGEVEYDLESTIGRIIEYMENGCRLKRQYQQRIDAFFAFHDKQNCQRVYEKIVEMDS